MGGERIGEALRLCAPEENRSGWMAEQADILRVGERTFSTWFYGRAAPDAENLIKLMGHFGPSFIDAVLAPTGYRVASEDEAAMLDGLRDNIEMIENAAKGIRAVVEGGKG